MRIRAVFAAFLGMICIAPAAHASLYVDAIGFCESESSGTCSSWTWADYDDDEIQASMESCYDSTCGASSCYCAVFMVCDPGALTDIYQLRMYVVWTTQAETLVGYYWDMDGGYYENQGLWDPSVDSETSYYPAYYVVHESSDMDSPSVAAHAI